MIAELVAPLTVSIISQFLRLCSVEHNKKNWLFSQSVKGAGTSVAVYIIVKMAKAHKLNIYEYLKYVLERRLDNTWMDEQLLELAPWSEKLQSIKKSQSD